MSKILLIIEDDPYVRRVYERLFKFSGYEVEFAENGRVGLKRAKILIPELILLDILLPDMNGLEILAELKKDPEVSSVPVIMLTNLGDDQTIRKATELNADGYIVKSSAPPEKLLKMVDKYL